jgi:hypothetical protein
MEKVLNDILADPDWRANLESRYWPKVAKTTPDECWIWQAAAKHPFGYGRMTAGRGVHIKAHQIAWALANGPIPEEACVLHRCDNPPCCNPAHLFLGSKKDNTRDMMAKNRHSTPPRMVGAAHPRAKFSDAQVNAIINDPRDAKLVAAEYGTSAKTVYEYRKKGRR